MKRDRILVVEDEILAWVAVREHIKQGVRDVEVERIDGMPVELNEWLTKAKELSLAIVDLQLPGEVAFAPDGGFDAIERIGCHFPMVPIIVLTQRQDREAWELAKRYKAIRFFHVKPWKKSDLQRDIQACLQHPARQPIELRGELE